MSSILVTPSTIQGIKRLSKSIGRDQKVTHSKALDIAAQRAGFSSFRHAKNHLGTDSRSQTQREVAIFPMWITAYWRDKESRSGRETVCVSCRLPWGSVLKKSELSAARGLRGFRVDAADHLESRMDMVDQDAARREVCEAARTLQFMEITGLRPLTGQVYQLTRGAEKLPRRDHASAWRDPYTQAIVVVDEPYSTSIEGLLEERAPWAKSASAAIDATSWPGMYVPGASTMFLTSLDGREELLVSLRKQLDAASPPIDAEKWIGESASYEPLFISPARAESGRSKRGRPKPLYRGLVRNNAVVYGHVFSGGAWRPNARMPLDGHREAANLLQELLEQGGFRSQAYTRLNHVRSELDEWVQREYTSEDELSNEAFHNLYYHAFMSTGLTATEALLRVAELIRPHYPDCVPRRDLLRSLAAARKDLEKR